MKLSCESISALDIGCSGDKPVAWRKLGDLIKFYGCDPLVNEINLLTSKNPKDKYISGFVYDIGCKGKSDKLTSNFFSRTSAAHDANSGQLLVAENYNHGQEIEYSKDAYTVSQLLDRFKLNKVDLLKIDVDGDDFAILKAFFSLNENFVSGLLAFEIESQFHGDQGEYGNHFANIMALANKYGFYLYKLDPYTYSRAALPRKYVFDFPAQTHGGQVLWADALFCRDVFELSEYEDIEKLICIYDAYGLEDCALEGMIQHSSLLKLRPQSILNYKKYHKEQGSKLKRLLSKIRQKACYKFKGN